MAKGLVTQCVCLLTDGQTTIDDIRTVIEQNDFEVVKQAPPSTEWQFAGPALIVSYLPEINGYVVVDIANHIWPDTMGDPKTETMTFGAWSMGQFGPFTFPGGLVRAGQHSCNWSPGKTIAAAHRGFIRIRISYCYGAHGSDPVFPADYDPMPEMMFLSRMVLAVLAAPGVICYFNPNGEVLRDRASFSQFWRGCTAAERIPIQLWTNVRFFYLNDQLKFMDTVGNAQLDIPVGNRQRLLRDVEVIYPSAQYQPGVIDNYLRNVSIYLLGLDRDLETGEDIDGPGETNLPWTMEALDESLVEPPRRVLRLYPKAISNSVRAAVAAIKGK